MPDLTLQQSDALRNLETDVLVLEHYNPPRRDHWYRYSTAATRVYRSTSGWCVEYDLSGRVGWYGHGWVGGSDHATVANALEAARYARALVENRLDRDAGGAPTPVASGTWSAYVGCSPCPYPNASWARHTPEDQAAMRNIVTPADLRDDIKEGREAKELAELEKDYTRLPPGSKTAPVGQWHILPTGHRCYTLEDGTAVRYKDKETWSAGSRSPVAHNTALSAALHAHENARRLDASDEKELAELEKDYTRLPPGSKAAPVGKWFIDRDGVRLFDSGREWEAAYYGTETKSPGSVKWNNHHNRLAAALHARALVAERLEKERREAREAKKKPPHPTHLEVGQVWRCDKTGSKRTVVETNRQDRFVVGIGSERATLVVDPDTLRITKVDGLTYLGRMAFTPADKE